MNELEKAWNIGTGTHEEHGSGRVVAPIQGESIDSWLQQSVLLVAGCVKGLGTNQRRVRYFGFETTHEQTEG
jgi:hypothetical protein